MWYEEEKGINVTSWILLMYCRIYTIDDRNHTNDGRCVNGEMNEINDRSFADNNHNATGTDILYTGKN